MSDVRKRYFLRLVGRIVIFIVCGLVAILRPDSFAILDGMQFFGNLSPFHLLWGIWMVDMLLQIVPIKNRIPLGSQKLFANRFRPIREKISRQTLRDHIIATTKAAYKVMLLWCGLVAALGALYYGGIINKIGLFLVSTAFYVCDLICVLIWCPFRLVMKNKCCTTCRIFNWDHLMMFSPLVFVGGFFSLSLVGMAILAWLVWELCVLIYPERFSEMSNMALKCSESTDKLCTQYCQKLR